ncbi:class I SAM-dependent methyltransferase [Hyphococcus sp.]|jgi:hypothetical protein|uniref:class I SAM-dependent methyltransferase n=1 Tax=Hyphococcus sp. TaxID=2038636 RepID=UPI003D14E465
MPYNTKIPGQQSDFELRAIELAASLVPENGLAVEIGSLFGRSSWAWAKSIPESAKLVCVDPWEPSPGSTPLEQRYGVKYSLETFQKHLSDCPNVEAVQGYSPDAVQGWDRPIDLFFEDAVHRNPIFEQNINFWSSHLKPTGVASGDDYRPRYPDIVNGVNKLAKSLGRSIITVDFFWCVLPSEKELPGAGLAAEKLMALSKEAYDFNVSEMPVVFAEPLSVFKTVKINEPRKVKVRVCSFYADNWRPASDGRKVEMAVRVYQEGRTKEAPVAENRVTLDTSVLYPDQPIEFEMELPTRNMKPGKHFALYGVFDESGEQFMSERRGVPHFIPYEYLK